MNQKESDPERLFLECEEVFWQEATDRLKNLRNVNQHVNPYAAYIIDYLTKTTGMAAELRVDLQLPNAFWDIADINQQMRICKDGVSRIAARLSRRSGLPPRTPLPSDIGPLASTNYSDIGGIVSNTGVMQNSSININKNPADFDELISKLAELVKAIQGLGENVMSTERKAQLSGELSAGIDIAGTPKPNRSGLLLYVLAPLRWLLNNVTKDALGQATHDAVRVGYEIAKRLFGG